MNSVQLIGNLTKDPELVTTPGQETICALRIAVDRMGPDGARGYVDVTVFGRSAAAAERILTQGWLVGVSGRLRYREWRAADGAQRSGLSIAGAVDFLAPPRRQDVADDAVRDGGRDA